MKFVALTLALDGFPFIPGILNTLNRTDLDWRWLIAEGAAANTGTTRWCKPQPPRLSRDGTTEFLNSLRNHPRVRVLQRQWWEGGKDHMCQALLNTIKEPCLLMQIDADESWESWQLMTIAEQFKNNPQYDCARFDCIYMVGPNIRTVGHGCYGNNPGEWLRVWRFTPGQKMTHEPPCLHGTNGVNECCMDNAMTRNLGLVFYHSAYVYPQQVAYKEKFYGYPNALAQWQRLQKNTVWPCKLKTYLDWSDDRAQADLLHKL